MTQPLTHARIGYDSIARRGSVSASSAASGFPASAAANDLTYSSWKPSSMPASWEVQLNEAEAVDYVGIAAHNLKTVDALAMIQAYISGKWRTLPLPSSGREHFWNYEQLEFKSHDLLDLSSGEGSRRRGIGELGGHTVVNEDGVAESDIGSHSFTSEVATDNLFNDSVHEAADLGSYQAINGATVSLTSGGPTVYGTSSVRVETDAADEGVQIQKSAGTSITPGVDVATSFYILNEGQDDLSMDVELDDLVGASTSKTITAYAGKWTRVTIEHAYDAGAGGGAVINVTCNDDSGRFVVCSPKIEESSYATTYGDRSSTTPVYSPTELEIENEVTMLCRLRFPDSNPASSTYIVALDSTVYLAWAGGVFRAALATGTGTVSIAEAFGGQYGLNDGEWHDIALTVSYDAGDSTLTLYVDGVSKGSTTVSNALDFSSDNITDLQVGHTSGVFTIGAQDVLLDGLLVRNYAMTAEEITSYVSDGFDLSYNLLNTSSNDRAIMRLLTSVTADRFRLYVAGETAPALGVIFIGQALEMTRPIYGGHSPQALNRETVLMPNESEGGQFLGRSIIRMGSRGSFAWTNLDPDWVRSTFDPFIQHALIRPWFILWRPSRFPNEADYCWTQGDISPQNSGKRGLMDVTVSAKGLGLE